MVIPDVRQPFPGFYAFGARPSSRSPTSISATKKPPGRCSRFNLEVAAGERLAMLGPSEAGKSTLALCLQGLISRMIKGDFRGARGGRLPHHHLPAPATGRAGGDSAPGFRGPDLLHPGGPGGGLRPGKPGAAPGGAAATGPECLDLMGLAGLDARDPAALSGGQKQLLALAAVLALAPGFWSWTNPPPISIPCGWRNSWPPWTASAGPGTSPWSSWEKSAPGPPLLPDTSFLTGAKSWPTAPRSGSSGKWNSSGGWASSRRSCPPCSTTWGRHPPLNLEEAVDQARGLGWDSGLAHEWPSIPAPEAAGAGTPALPTRFWPCAG